jgi:type IV secretion system protein VirB5
MALSTNSNAIFGVGDVVYDPAAVYQAIEQVTQLKKQVTLMKKTAVATCGIKDAVKMYSDMKQLTETMKEFKVSLDDLDIDNPKSKIGQMAQKIFNDNQIFDNCNQPCNSELQKQVCKDSQIRNVGEIATAMVYGDELGEAAKRLEKLGKKLAKSKDIKTSQDIGNALSLELAQLQISKSRVDMMTKMNDSKCKADKDRLKQEADEKWGTPVQINL